MTDTTSKSASYAAIKLPTVKDLLEAGVHFGHETKRWNPAFEDYIFTKRGEFHIIDLEKTLEKLDEALKFITKAAAEGEILIVGTKRQARGIVKEEATRCGAHFVINRWIGGQVTNFDRISTSIKKLRSIEEKLEGDIEEYSQQELSTLRREWARLDRLFGGVKQMDRVPGAVIIIDALYEKIPLKEIRVANVPVVALVDSNTDPAGIEYPVPGNDDAIKSVKLFMKYFADAVLAGNKGNGVKHFFKDYSTVGIKAEDLKQKSVAKEVSKKVQEKEEIKKKQVVSKEEEKAVTKKPTKTSTKTVPTKKVKKATKTTSAKGKIKAGTGTKKATKKKPIAKNESTTKKKTTIKKKK
ncbi:MAG: 30S ribosomal protein S2 [Candidatus Dojkabacteria bacterium]|nr:30S ribosomal protein S2 [Candidatus Dojkabacteria bacterium]